MALVEGTDEADLVILEAELEQTRLEPEGVRVEVPVADNERVRAQAKLSRREHAAEAPGRKDWKDLVRPNWDKNFPWHDVRVNKETKAAKIFCLLCEKHRQDTPFASTGSVSFKTDALSGHAASACHVHAVRCEGSADVMKDVMQKTLTLEQETAINLFQAAYWIAKEDVALLKYGSLLDLLKDTGSQVPPELYHNNKAALLFIDACAEAIF
jgi:hypothetical protein